MFLDILEDYTCLWDAPSEEYLKRVKKQLAMEKTSFTPIIKICSLTLGLAPTYDIFTTVYVRETRSISVR